VLSPKLANKKMPAKKKAKTTMKDDTLSKKKKLIPEMKKSKHIKPKKEGPKLANVKTPAKMMAKTKTKDVTRHLHFLQLARKFLLSART
jgi:hypothetical protein